MDGQIMTCVYGFQPPQSGLTPLQVFHLKTFHSSFIFLFQSPLRNFPGILSLTPSFSINSSVEIVGSAC